MISAFSGDNELAERTDRARLCMGRAASVTAIKVKMEALMMEPDAASVRADRKEMQSHNPVILGRSGGAHETTS